MNERARDRAMELASESEKDICICTFLHYGSGGRAQYTISAHLQSKVDHNLVSGRGKEAEMSNYRSEIISDVNRVVCFEICTPCLFCPSSLLVQFSKQNTQ